MPAAHRALAGRARHDRARRWRALPGAAPGRSAPARRDGRSAARALERLVRGAGGGRDASASSATTTSTASPRRRVLTARPARAGRATWFRASPAATPATGWVPDDVRALRRRGLPRAWSPATAAPAITRPSRAARAAASTSSSSITTRSPRARARLRAHQPAPADDCVSLQGAGLVRASPSISPRALRTRLAPPAVRPARRCSISWRSARSPIWCRWSTRTASSSRPACATLTARKRPGLAALAARAQLGRGRPPPHDVAFRLTPRLNAAGRLGEAQLALDFLLARRCRAAERSGRGARRRNTRAAAHPGAGLDRGAPRRPAQADETRARAGGRGRGWHAGVVGIIAARLVDASRGPPSPSVSAMAQGAAPRARSPASNLYDALHALPRITCRLRRARRRRRHERRDRAARQASAPRSRREARAVCPRGRPSLRAVDAEVGPCAI